MNKLLLILVFIPSILFAEPYSILSAQGTTGSNDLKDSSSLLINLGVGYQIREGFYIDWAAGLNIKLLFDKIYTTSENQQRVQMDLLSGYKFKLTKNSYFRFGAGIKAAIFHGNCKYYPFENSTTCHKKHDYGPTYKAGYYFETRKKGMLGFEYSKDELSNKRKYDGLSFVIISYF